MPWPVQIAWRGGGNRYTNINCLLSYSLDQLDKLEAVGRCSPLHEVHAVLGLHVKNSLRLNKLEHL